MIRALVVSNGIGAEEAFPSTSEICFDVVQVTPIVEHGIQQIRHLDNFVDSLTEWLCGVRPQGSFKILPEHYGVADYRW